MVKASCLVFFTLYTADYLILTTYLLTRTVREHHFLQNSTFPSIEHEKFINSCHLNVVKDLPPLELSLPHDWYASTFC